MTFRSVDPGAARREVRDGDLDAAIVIPARYSASQRTARPAPLLVLRDRPISGQVAEGVARRVAGGVGRVRVSVATAADAGVPPQEIAAQARRGAAAPLELTTRRPEGDELSVAAYFGASMAIMFLYFTIGLAGRALFQERAGGTLQRILATPTSAAQLVAGKTLALATLGALGFLTMWLVTSLAFGGRWGHPLGVVALIFATVFAISGVSLLVATLAGSERRADARTSIVGLVFALVGGNFVSPEASPPLLRELSLATPNGWALRGFTDLGTGVAEASDIAAAVGVLLGIGVLFGLAGFLRGQRVARG